MDPAQHLSPKEKFLDFQTSSPLLQTFLDEGRDHLTISLFRFCQILLLSIYFDLLELIDLNVII